MQLMNFRVMCDGSWYYTLNLCQIVPQYYLELDYSNPINGSRINL